jgi:hypothetical protein
LIKINVCKGRRVSSLMVLFTINLLQITGTQVSQYTLFWRTLKIFRVLPRGWRLWNVHYDIIALLLRDTILLLFNVCCIWCTMFQYFDLLPS